MLRNLGRRKKMNGFSPVKNRRKTICFFRDLFILFLQPFLKEEQSILKIEHIYFFILGTFTAYD